MISSTSFTTQTDFFARLLSQKLENLDNNSKLSQSVNIGEDFFTKAKNSCNMNGDVKSCSDRLQRILDNGIHSSDRIRPNVPPNCQVLGTTFPPNRFVSCDLIRAKFQKESNLLHQIHLKGQQQHQDESEMNNLSEPVDIPLSNGSADSEMLFDFDIGSPETPEETGSYNKIVNGVEDMEMENLNINYSKISHTSDMFLQSLSSPDDSITCQSTSSGLFSEPFTPSPPEKENNHSDLDDLNENILFPEEWFINHLNSNDEVTPKVLSPVTSTQNMSNNSNGTEQVPESESDKDMGFEDFKVPIGNEEKTVASSKLEALLSQLQSDPKPIDWAFENGQKSRILNSSKIISTSPANFSYLKESDVGQKIDDEVEEPKSVPKSFSVYEMSEYEKSALIEESGNREAANSDNNSQNEPTEDSKNKYRKCSSLRSGKTPPSTPGRRKIVRFADIFGLDLADVKTFLDDIPKVPKSAFKDLKDADISDLESDSGSEVHSGDHQHSGHTSFLTGTSQPTPTIAPLFNQPGGSSEFFNVLRDKKICLENAFMADSENIRGTVRVVNLDFNKKVVIRYTFDDWITSETIDGVYLQGSCDGFSDKFTFLLDYKQISGMVGKRLQFCVKFECLGFEYWDNNFGRNYIFQVFGPVSIRPAIPTPPPSSYITPSAPIAPYVPKSSGRSSSFRRRSSPICARPAPTVPSSTHFSTFSHSPSTSDDPWLRY